jgi:hypothetical protein
MGGYRHVQPVHVMAAMEEQHKIQALWAWVSFFWDNEQFVPHEDCNLDYLLRQVRPLERRHVSLFRGIDRVQRGAVHRDELRAVCTTHGLMWGAAREQKLEALFTELATTETGGRINLRTFLLEAHRWMALRMQSRPHQEMMALETTDGDGMRWMSAPGSGSVGLVSAGMAATRHNLGETMLLSEVDTGPHRRSRSPRKAPAPPAREDDDAMASPSSYDRISMSRQMRVDTTSPSGRRWQHVVAKLSECSESTSIGSMVGAIIRSIYQDGPSSIAWASVSHRVRILRQQMPPAVSNLSRTLLKAYQRGRSIVLLGSPPQHDDRPAEENVVGDMRGLLHIVSVDAVHVHHPGCPTNPFVLCFGLRGPFDIMMFPPPKVSPTTEAIKQLVDAAREACALSNNNGGGGGGGGSGLPVNGRRSRDARLIAYVGGDVSELGRTGPIEMASRSVLRDDDGDGDGDGDGGDDVADSTTKAMMHSSCFTAYPPPRVHAPRPPASTTASARGTATSEREGDHGEAAARTHHPGLTGFLAPHYGQTGGTLSAREPLTSTSRDKARNAHAARRKTGRGRASAAADSNRLATIKRLQQAVDYAPPPPPAPLRRGRATQRPAPRRAAAAVIGL